MGVSGVGSVYKYTYNPATGKLSASDGSQDYFVDYFNGEYDEETLDSLNGFDAKRKSELKTLFEVFAPNSKQAMDLMQTGEEIEVTCEIEDAATAHYSVNGGKILTAYAASPFTYVDSSFFSSEKMTQPYRTVHSQGYNPSDNSINLAVGDRIDLENGYAIQIKRNCVSVEGYETETNNKNLNNLVSGLDALIRFADQQCSSAILDLHQDSMPMLFDLLDELGVDTSREFIINGTKCEIVNGKIREAGNSHMIPGSVYRQALKKYEDACYQPLKTWQST